MYSYTLHNHDIFTTHLTQSEDASPFEDLLASIAAEHFPLNDDKSAFEQIASPLSAASSITASSRATSATPSPRLHVHDIDDDKSDDLDDDIKEFAIRNSEPFDTSNTCDPLANDDKPYLPHAARKKGFTKQERKNMAGKTPYRPSVIECTPPSRLASHLSYSALFAMDDDDAEDAPGGNTTDDEYVPAIWHGPRKRRRAHPETGKRQRSTESEEAPLKKRYRPTQSRNAQATSPARIQSASKRLGQELICPECGWKQRNQRLPDFKRHLRTHTRPSNKDQSSGWWCKGVRVEDADTFGIADKVDQAYSFSGVWRVGGCQRTFARRDALKRHLDNPNVLCVGVAGTVADE